MSESFLCKYKNIFGEPNKGVHSYRLFDVAIVDVLLTIIVGYMIHKRNKKIELYKILICLFAFGIIMHRLFCVRTKIDRLLFP